ncbi:MAG: LacI family DNA-binding transcriptional regulator [Clostridia bacterium]|nr:LacI family DNA-binding transcriptional regulator [Clostridia bacterium]
MEKITIYDVAKAAGFSTATVSLALQDDPRVRQETKKRVLEVVDELGYIPNYMAQSLSKQSTHTLGLIVPSLENPLFAQMISGVEECANDRGYNLILGVPNYNQEKEAFYLDLLQQRRVDGLLIFPTFVEMIANKLANRNKRAAVPVVFCGSAVPGLPDVSYVKCDNRMGAYIAIDYLIQSGRKRIGFILPVATEQNAHSRKTGYQDALAFHGIPFDPELLVFCSPNTEDVRRATLELLNRPGLDAIFCLYDYIAITVMHVLTAQKKRIPQDIAIVGYDNIHLSAHLPIPLSTIDTHGQRVGRMATEILLDTIENPESEARQIVLKPELVVRESTSGIGERLSIPL